LSHADATNIKELAMSDASKPVTASRGTTGAPSSPSPSTSPGAAPQIAERQPHFIDEIIAAHASTNRWGVWTQADDAGGVSRSGKPRVRTRFPPEPNGYLHLGHAKSICLNFGLAERYAGKFNLRFDDTNPAKEEQEYVDSIIRDVLWLGGDFLGPHGGGLHYASDWFGLMAEYAEELIHAGKAYVCTLTAEEVSARRGTPSTPATSPHRERPVEESLRLFREMREGKHPNGAMTLRAKIDLASPNFNLRDPVMYRILHEHHQHTGSTWCIYPMYDWAHGIEDGVEGITHSICTLEFENHRPLYDWFMRSINEARTARGKPGVHHSQQIEFAKLQLTYTMMSKRNLLRLVEGKHVSGWDDPRMPTLAGVRRRGFPAAALRAFCEEVGVTKQESLIDVGRLENAARDYLNKHAPRAMCVLRPLLVEITNWPKNPDGTSVVEMLDFVINPEALERSQESGQDASAAPATRRIPFSGTLYIEAEDFMEVAPKKFYRLTPGNEVRLRWAYFIKCTGFEKDASGNITKVLCTYDPATKGGDAPAGPNGEPPRKVKATLHWVSADHAIEGEVRLYDRLFKAEEPGKATGNFMDDLNPNALEVVRGAKLDPHLRNAALHRTTRTWTDHGKAHEVTIEQGEVYQFERLGYFALDKDSSQSKLVFSRTVTLKDSWAKERV
jgi:glutaminyl-tRNA synthetase